MGERRINWGDSETDARYITEDTGTGANFTVVEDLNGNTVVLQYDQTNLVANVPIDISSTGIVGTDVIGGTNIDLADIAGVGLTVDATDDELDVPAQVLEEAATFTESDVTVTTNQTQVANGSLELRDFAALIDDFESGDLVVENSNFNDWVGDTGSLSAQQTTVLRDSWSAEFTVANADLEVHTDRTSAYTPGNFRVYVEMDNNSGTNGDRTRVNLQNSTTPVMEVQFEQSDGSISVSGSSDQSGDGTWSINTTYRIDWLNIDYSSDEFDITIRDIDSGTDVYRDTGATFSNSVSDIDRFKVRAETDFGGETTNVYFDDVGDGTTPTSGDALVAWDSGIPDDIRSWDLATLQQTPDGETVTVDVEDSQGNVLVSDIGQDADISGVATSNDVQLRANLSRTNTANNPTVDYLARRYFR